MEPISGRARHAETESPITAFLDMGEVLRRATALVCDAAHASACRILLHDATVHEFVVAAAAGPGSDRISGRRFADTSGLAASVLTSDQARIAAQLTADHDVALVEMDRASAGGVRSMMAAPLTAAGRTVGVVEAVNRTDGAPFGGDDLTQLVTSAGLISVALENASLHRRLDQHVEILKRTDDDRARPLIAVSPSMRRALAEAELAARGRSTVLIIGHTGTGKEQVARRIHAFSPRANRPFVPLNCGAMPEALVESELFGHERGAFTGADRRHLGRFELADGGTLFLDEIGELPPPAQVKLLRVLQEREISRVGGTQSIPVDVRLIAATHRDLAVEVREGRFREDLFFRIHVVPIRLPALAERPEDIEPLVELLLRRFARELARRPRQLTPEGLARLQAYQWPGNVRELENLVERLMVLGSDEPIHADDLIGLLPDPVPPPSRETDASAPTTEDTSLWEQEHALLVHALERTGHNQTHAAMLLKISREQLRTRMRRYGLLPKT